jgi:hypothetical protein
VFCLLSRWYYSVAIFTEYIWHNPCLSSFENIVRIITRLQQIIRKFQASRCRFRPFSVASWTVLPVNDVITYSISLWLMGIFIATWSMSISSTVAFSEDCPPLSGSETLIWCSVERKAYIRIYKDFLGFFGICFGIFIKRSEVHFLILNYMKLDINNSWPFKFVLQ